MTSYDQERKGIGQSKFECAAEDPIHRTIPAFRQKMCAYRDYLDGGDTSFWRC